MEELILDAFGAVIVEAETPSDDIDLGVPDSGNEDDDVVGEEAGPASASSWQEPGQPDPEDEDEDDDDSEPNLNLRYDFDLVPKQG